MNISDLVSALHQHMGEHGDLCVSVKGDGSAAHCVYHSDGWFIISDSYFDGVHNLFGSDDETGEEEETFHLGGGEGSASSLISILHSRLSECGDLTVCPNGSNSGIFASVYEEDGRLIISDSSFASLAASSAV